MAESPSHKFGQMIGDLLEEAMYPLLLECAQKSGLYLDKAGPRSARNGKKKVSWKDYFGNVHDLDFVLERNGTDKIIGQPVAFIESAWRRYTKHSRNKAQEIQSAIIPLASTYKNNAPFIGVVLAGDFTNGSLTQLSSQGFSILFFSYEKVIEAFNTVGIDADFDEDTPDCDFSKKVEGCLKLNPESRKKMLDFLVESNSKEIISFLANLERAINRSIKNVYILPLFGSQEVFTTVEDAVLFLNNFENKIGSDVQIFKFEVTITYNNGDSIVATFSGKEDVIAFLRNYLPHKFLPTM